MARGWDPASRHLNTVAVGLDDQEWIVKMSLKGEHVWVPRAQQTRVVPSDLLSLMAPTKDTLRMFGGSR